MQKKHYLIAAFLILAISFLVSFNGSSITGKFSKDITGDVVSTLSDAAIYSIADANGAAITSCTGKTAFLPLSGCEKAYNKNKFDGFATGRYDNLDVKFNFAKVNINKIYIYAGANFKNPNLIFSDGSSLPSGTLTADAWNEITVNKDNIQSIEIAWTTSNQVTGLFEIVIEKKSTVSCSDSDKGKNYSVKGIVTADQVYTDSCIQFTPSLTYPTECYGIPSGGLCRLREYFCETVPSGVKSNFIDYICPSGACSNGKCVECISTSPCPTGTTCSNGVCVQQEEETCADLTPLGKGRCMQANDFSDVYDDVISYCASKNIEGCTGGYCEWFGDPINGCKPKTYCVWTNGHCCGAGMRYKEIRSGIFQCQETAPGDLCFSFWPDYKVKDKSVKYSVNEVCWDIGSSVYGYWTFVNIY